MKTGGEGGMSNTHALTLERDRAYRSMPHVSASELGKLIAKDQGLDPTKFYMQGTLFDAMALEYESIDFNGLKVGEYKISYEDIELCGRMVRALRNHPAYEQIQGCEFQKIFTGHNCGLDAKCKYDFWSPWLSGDLKSTACTSQKSFEAAFERFNYDLQRVWYMNLSGAPRDMVIAVSKEYHPKTFTIVIERGDPIWRSGMAKIERACELYKWMGVSL